MARLRPALRCIPTPRTPDGYVGFRSERLGRVREQSPRYEEFDADRAIRVLVGFVL